MEWYMYLKVIACNVFFREISYCAALSPHTIDVEFFELGEHIHSDSLRKNILRRIAQTEQAAKQYDAILLGFGLCGNTAVGISAQHHRLIIPRAHDCCTILLGDKALFKANFEGNPSTPFSSTGYMERGEYFVRKGDGQVVYGDAYAALVQQYGEEDAKFVWEAMHPKMEGEEERAIFIDIPEFRFPEKVAKFKQQAEEEGKKFVQLQGSMRIIRDLLNGNWNDADFLTVLPGEKIVPLYDWDRVINAGIN
jgi:hypothetical protein